MQGFVGGRRAEHLTHGLDAHVAVRQLPLIVGLEPHGADEPDDGLLRGKDADDVGAAFDLLVQALQRVRRMQLGPVLRRELGREGIPAARCTVARLMRQMGLAGVVRGRSMRTTVPDKATPCPADKVNRQFQAPRPNQLWVSDFTYVATWQGFVFVAFIIDVFARRIGGWRVSRNAQAGFVLDALEQALHDRRPPRGSGLVHHSDRGVQYVSIRYTDRLAAAGIEPSVGSVGDSYDNALAETVIGLFKTEVIWRIGPWKSLEAVEYATLEWVDWFNHRRLLEPIGNIPPAEAEARYYANQQEVALAA